MSDSHVCRDLVKSILAAIFALLLAIPAGASCGRHEIVFIDAAVRNSRVIEECVQPGTEIVRLGSGSDGMAQIAAALKGRRGIDAIHVVSHGSPGQLLLGATTLTSDNLDRYSPEFSTLRSALTRGADIILYGCNVAEGERGKSFVRRLAASTGAAVAASADITGSPEKGGDTSLEYSIGPVKSRILKGLELYPDTLAAITYTFDADTQGWTGDLTYWGGAISSGTNAGSVNSYPPAARYIQTMDIRSYITTYGADYTMNAYYQGSVVYSRTISVNQGSFVNITLNKNVDRLQFVNLGGGNGWMYPEIDNVVTQDVIANSAPTLTGSQSTAINDQQTASPFSNLTAADANGDNVSLTITYTAANGTLSGSGLSGAAGSYTMSAASPATITSQLRALVFTPTNNQVAPGASVTTTFSITPSDPWASGSANTGSQVTVTSLNDPPTDITLSGNNVSRFAGVNAVVGALSSTDADTGDSHSYSLVAGAGDTDNALFNISGDILRANDTGSMAEGSYSVRIQSTDSQGGNYSTSFTVTVTLYPAITANNTDTSDTIRRVVFGSIDNTSGIEAGGYGDYSAESTAINRGDSADLSVDVGSTYVGSPQGTWSIKVYFDWNHNGNFTDAGEGLEVQYNIPRTSIANPGYTTFTKPITVPADALLGGTRMRIVYRWQENLDEPVPSSGNFGYGEAEDYTVNVYVPPAVTGISPSGGPVAGGTPVVITGTDFTDVTAVTFGATSASSFIVDSPNQITATSPAGAAGTVDITVTTPGGTNTISAADQFTYKEPTVTVLTSSANPSVYGQTIIFTAAVTAGSSIPTGTVTFKSDGLDISGCADSALDGSAQATCTTSALKAVGSTHTITTVYIGDAVYLPSTSSGLSQSINTKPLTLGGITASNKVYDGATSATLNTAGITFTGLIGGDTVTLGGAGVGNFLDKNVGNGKTVIVSGYTLGGADAANYSVGQPNGLTADITQKALSVNGVTVNNKVYDGTITAALNTGGAILSGNIGGDDVTLSVAGADGSFADANAGNGKGVIVSGFSISGTDAGNYTLTQPTGLTADITPADTTTTIISDAPDPSEVGTAVAVFYTVTPVAPGGGTPTGNVTVGDGVDSCTDAVAAGSCSITLTTPGARTLTASYDGDSNFSGSASSGVPHGACFNSITVTDTGDNGPGTLRQAIMDICSGGTIDFNLTYPATITLSSGQLVIDKDMTISGPGAADLTISGGNASRVFYVTAGVTVTIQDVAVSSGRGGYGGGIYNQYGILSVTRTAISGNNAVGGNGGGLWSNGTLTITGSTVTGNSALSGGGIYNDAGSLTLTDTTVSGNITTVNGGGIHNYSGPLTITGSTFSGNSATNAGGGLYDEVGTLILSNSTVSGNSADSGGGIETSGSLAVTITDSTVSDNSANASGGGIWNNGTLAFTNSTLWGNSANVDGGGIWNANTLSVTTSILAANNAGGNCAGTITDGGYNLDDGATCGLSDPTSLSNTDPLLDPKGPQDNGGPTQTIALLPGSPAIDAIPSGTNGCGTTITTDQRGIASPQNSSCDIGAFESQGFTITKTGGDNQSTLINTAFGTSLQVTVTSNATPAEPVDGGNVILTAPSSGASITVTPITATISSGGVSQSVTANGTAGFYSVTASAIGATSVDFTLDNFYDTTTAVAASLNPSVFGQSITFTATVSVVSPGTGTPTGTVTFKDGATTLGTGTLNGSGQATFTTSSLTAGTHSITAEYGGDSSFAPSVSSPLMQAVNAAATTTGAASSLNPSNFGQSVTFTATVTSGAGTPTGTVTFKDGVTTLGTGALSGGTATYSTSSLSAGSHSITAAYEGDTTFAGSTSSPITQSVYPTTVTIPAATGNGDITISTSSPGCGFYNVATKTEAQVGSDPAFDYPYGLVEFRLSCAEADVTITYPGSIMGTYRKYGPTTPGNSATTKWYTFTNATASGNSVTLHLTDGQLGDDTEVDGIIVDQGGPGLPPGGAVAVPTMTEWGMMIFGLLAGLASALHLRRRKRRSA